MPNLPIEVLEEEERSAYYAYVAECQRPKGYGRRSPKRVREAREVWHAALKALADESLRLRREQ